MSTTIGLSNPNGTINKSGRSAAGSTSEIELITAVTVPSGDEHHLTDVTFSVKKGAAGTIFRLYGRSSGEPVDADRRDRVRGLRLLHPQLGYFEEDPRRPPVARDRPAGHRRAHGHRGPRHREELRREGLHVTAYARFTDPGSSGRRRCDRAHAD